MPIGCECRWCLLVVLIAAIGGCGGGGDASGPDPAGVTCIDRLITPQEYTRSLPSQTGQLTSFEMSGHPIYSYILLTIASACLSGDCSGAHINWRSGGVFVGVRVEGTKLEGCEQGVCPVYLHSSNPPKEAQVWVRFSGTYHECYTW